MLQQLKLGQTISGKRGTPKRDDLESGYEAFKIGALIHDTRIELGMTQGQLAEKVGTTKSYISKIENNLKEARLSTLQKIIEVGFGDVRYRISCQNPPIQVATPSYFLTRPTAFRIHDFIPIQKPHGYSLNVLTFLGQGHVIIAIGIFGKSKLGILV